MYETPTIIECEQNSPEWDEARRGVPTASRFSDIVAKGNRLTRNTYLYTLVGEILTGKCEETIQTRSMRRGHIMEAEARSRYAFIHDCEPRLVGFIRRGDVGCSPDAIIGDDGTLEIKTKVAHAHIAVLEKGELPAEHVAQVQGGLWVTERSWCDFISYWPGIVPFEIRVHRDQDYIAMLAREVADFVVERDMLVEKYRMRPPTTTEEVLWKPR